MTSQDKPVARSYGVEFVIEPLEGKDVPAVMERVARNISGTYWLSAGTMLGLYRDAGPIPHDTDLDFAILGGQCDIRMPEDFKLFRTIEADGKIMQECYIDQRQNVVVDFAHYWPLPNDKNILYTRGEDGSLYRTSSLALPTKIIFYEDHPYQAPNNIEEYLESWYGDWRTPRVGGKTQWK